MSDEKKEKNENLEEQNQADSSKEDEGNGSDEDPIIPDEVFEAIPEEDRGRVKSIVKETVFSGIMGRRNPVAEKITSDHITQLITTTDDQDKRDRKERGSVRWHNAGLIVLALLFVGFLIVYLQTNEDLLINIIIAILSFLGGFGFGKSYKN